MPFLVSLVEPAPNAPGFLLPLFRTDRSDSLLTQIIDYDEKTIDFKEIIIPNGTLINISGTRRDIQIGDPALWAFKEPDGILHIGDFKFISNIAEKIIDGGSLEDWPLARFELAIFANASQVDPFLVIAAYNDVENNEGKVAAQIWRDAEVYGPAVRHDISEFLGGEITRRGLDGIYVICRNKLNIVLPKKLMSSIRGIEWRYTRHYLSIFDHYPIINMIAFEDICNSVNSASWKIKGVGGVARFVIQSPPFKGVERRFAEGSTLSGAEATGRLPSEYSNSHILSQLICLCQSSQGHAENIVHDLEGFSSADSVRHLVNVRPFNFGSLPARKHSVAQLRTIGKNFDHIWIVAGHRQRRTGSYRNQLSVTNAASRLVKSLLSSIIYEADTISAFTRLKESEGPSVNLFGALRMHKDWSEEYMLRNLLHTMLCEEAILHSASSIFIFKPGIESPRSAVVSLGQHKMEVNIISANKSNKFNDWLAWAMSVKVANGDFSEFSDFCISILEGYGWTYRGRDGGILFFEDEGEALSIWAANNKSDVFTIISMPSSLPLELSPIITPISISKQLVGQALETGWTLIHYSEVEKYLYKVFKSARFSLSE